MSCIFCVIIRKNNLNEISLNFNVYKILLVFNDAYNRNLIQKIKWLTFKIDIFVIFNIKKEVS